MSLSKNAAVINIRKDQAQYQKSLVRKMKRSPKMFYSYVRSKQRNAVSGVCDYSSQYQRRRAIEALEARAPQYCDCGPDWPLLFKVHVI